MIDAICSTLDEMNTNYIRIVGSTPTNIRAELVERFQHAAACRCGVLSVTAAGAGLTLTAAALVLFAELHWNPGILTQAESRAHRMGRAGGVCVRYLLASGTADDIMWPMLQDKLDVLNNVGLSGETFENTTFTHQESQFQITQYLSPKSSYKNRNDYIPGTNIRKVPQSSDTNSNGNTGVNNEQTERELDSFMEHDETDELLADLAEDSELLADLAEDSELLADLAEDSELLATLDKDDELLANLDDNELFSNT
ncbi:unnamed protein product [Euphydryas editha]|nr:unnamed protein product [Euphydryas editha]